jgi:hypothetical protein
MTHRRPGAARPTSADQESGRRVACCMTLLARSTPRAELRCCPVWRQDCAGSGGRLPRRITSSATPRCRAGGRRADCTFAHQRALT